MKKCLSLWACLSLLLGGVPMPAVAAEAVKLVRIWPGYRGDSALLRVSDFFRRGQQTARSGFHRTDPDVREGMYFTVRLQAGTRRQISDGTIRLHVIAPDAAEPEIFDFPFQSGGRRSQKLELGLTGSDWTHGNILPMAWQLEVLDAMQQVVARESSFLWEMQP